MQSQQKRRNAMIRRWLFIVLLLMVAAGHAHADRRPAVAYPAAVPSRFEVVQDGRTLGIGDDGKTVWVHVGDHVILALGKDYNWMASTPAGGVLQPVPTVLAQLGCQGEYVAREVGHTQILAVGQLSCLESAPQGVTPARQFVVNVVVE